MGLLERRTPPARIAAIASAGAAASALAMTLSFHAQGDPSLGYFATISHCQGLLIGCALGAVLRPEAMTGAITPRARRLLRAIGLAALAVAGPAALDLTFRSGPAYHGGAAQQA